MKAKKHVRRHRRNDPGRKHKGRRHRRNPPTFSVKGIGSQVVTGAKDAGGVLLGEFGTNAIAGVVPVSGAVLTPVVKVASAIATAIIVRKFISARLAEFALAGGLATVVRPILKGLNIPIVSSRLGDDAMSVATYLPAAGAYPAIAGVSAYPAMQGMGDVGDLDLAYGATGGNY